MKRLIEEEGKLADRRDRVLVDLLRSVAPFEPNPFLKRLVYRRTVRGERPRRAWLVRAGALAGLLVGGTAMATAAYEGYAWLEHRASSAMAVLESMPDRADHESRSRITWKAPAAREQMTPPPSEPGAAPAAVAADDHDRPSEPTAAAARGASNRPAEPTRARVRSARLAAPAPAPRAAASSTDPSEDPSEVVDAVRALRKEGDAARAQKLLDRYLTSHPRGAFIEDALALAIEAASTLHDPRAASYAKRYLAQFPEGRFGAVARRALESGR